jgi:hypothetical protein
MRNLYRRICNPTQPHRDTKLGGGCDDECFVPVESTKTERKLRDALNRILKLVPSIRRLQELDRIAMELDAEADQLNRYGFVANADGLKADALYLRRLEYDLTSMREVKASIAPAAKRRGSNQEAPMRAASRYESSQWPRGERP